MEADTDDSERKLKLATPIDNKMSRNATVPRSLDLHQDSHKTPQIGGALDSLFKQRHALDTCDSGFSEYSSTFSETPRLSHTSALFSPTDPVSDAIEVSPASHRMSFPLRTRKLSFSSPSYESPQLDLQPSRNDSFADSAIHSPYSYPEENFYTRHRLSWPFMSRKIEFHSSSVPQSPTSNLPFRVENDSLYNDGAANKFELDQNEEEVNVESSKNLPQQESVCQALYRSRSCSRSPLSSSSEDIEDSLQEMSLEESSSSSDSAQPSPTSFNSSSPVFTFNRQSRLSESSTSQVEDRISHLTWDAQSTVIPSTNVPDSIAPFPKNSTGLNLEEKCLVSVPSHTALSLELKTNIEQTSCQGAKQSDFDFRLTQVHVSKSQMQPPQVRSISNDGHSIISKDSKHSEDTTSQVLSKTLSPHPKPSYDNSLHPYSFNLMKSPTKRNCPTAQISYTDTVSPLKMRKLRSDLISDSEKSALKKNLFGCVSGVKKQSNEQNFESGESLNNETIAWNCRFKSVHERSPQFLNFQSDPVKSSDCVEDNSRISTNHHHGTPVKWKSANSKINEKQQSEEASSAILVQRICLKFSPQYPSQLIGRHVGVKTFDIISELKQWNLIECLEIILSYIPDNDLVNFVEVNVTWKSALLQESKAHRRYKNVLRKLNSPRKMGNQAGKENMAGKLREKENVLMTASKGLLASIQPQFVTTEISGVSPLPKQPDLQSDDVLRNCPHCQCRAVVLPSQDRATCLSEKCAYDFCTKCFNAFHHPSPCKPLFYSASRTTLAGTKKSKKNLKRLKNI